MHGIADSFSDSHIEHRKRRAGANAGFAEAPGDKYGFWIGEEFSVGSVLLLRGGQIRVISNFEVLPQDRAHHGQLPFGLVAEFLRVLKITVIGRFHLLIKHAF